MEQTAHILVKFPDGTEAPMLLSPGFALHFPVLAIGDNDEPVDAMLEIHLVEITPNKAGSN